MRYLNGLKWMLLLATISTMANADLILDNVVVISDITGITVSPSSGDIFITTQSGDYTVTAGNTTPPSNDVEIISFSVTGTIEEGQSTVVSWTTSNATSCAASGNAPNWSGAQPVNGTRPVPIADQGSYTLTLTCQGQDGPVTRSRSVTVLPANTTPNPTSCSTPDLEGSSTDWLTFWGVSFPAPVTFSKIMTVPIRGFSALRFNSGDLEDDGKLFTIETTQTVGIRLGAISECPGDFNVDPECDYTWGLGGGIRYSINGARANACQLKSNTDYYFNVTFTDGSDPESSSCRTQPCMTTIQHSNRP